jgi:hypothetical protein
VGGGDGAGVEFSVSAAEDGSLERAAPRLDDGSEFSIRPRPIEIYCRGMNRSDYSRFTISRKG